MNTQKVVSGSFCSSLFAEFVNEKGGCANQTMASRFRDRKSKVKKKNYNVKNVIIWQISLIKVVSLYSDGFLKSETVKVKL